MNNMGCFEVNLTQLDNVYVMYITQTHTHIYIYIFIYLLHTNNAD